MMVWKCSTRCYGMCDKCLQRLQMIERDEVIEIMDWRVRMR